MDTVQYVLTILMCIGLLGHFIPTDGSSFAEHFRKNWWNLIPFAALLGWAAWVFLPLDALFDALWPIPISINTAVLIVQIIVGLALLVWVGIVCPRTRQDWTPWWTPVWVIGAIVLCTASFLYSLEQLKYPEVEKPPKVERED